MCLCVCVWCESVCLGVSVRVIAPVCFTVCSFGCLFVVCLFLCLSFVCLRLLVCGKCIILSVCVCVFVEMCL